MRKLAFLLFAVLLSSFAFAGDCSGSDTSLIRVSDSNTHLRDVLCWDGINLKVYSPFGVPNMTASEIFTFAAACPVGTTQDAAIDGQMVRGTIASRGDVATFGGHTTITPSGSVSAPSVTVSAITPAGTVSQPSFTGNPITFGTAVNVSLLGLGTALTGPTPVTPSGTVSQPSFSGSAVTPSASASAPNFTGSPVDPSPQFVRALFCTVN